MASAATQPLVTDVSNSAAFRFLDQQLQSGKITEHAVQEFKAQYQRLHEAVINAYAAESKLVEKGKELKALDALRRRETEAKKQSLDNAEETIRRLRRELAHSQEEFNLLEEQQRIIRYEQDELERTKQEKFETIQQRKAAQMATIEPEVRNLATTAEQLRKQIAAMTTQQTKEENQSAEYESQLDELDRKISQAELQRHQARMMVEQLAGQPDKEKLKADSLAKRVDSMKESELQLQREMDEYEHELTSLKEQKKERDEDLQSRGLKIAYLQDAIQKANYEISTMQKEMSAASVTAQAYETDLEYIEHQFTKLAQDKLNAKRKRDDTIKRLRRKEKEHEKLRRRRDTTASSLEPLKRNHAQMKEQLSDMEDHLKTQTQKLVELKEDEELFISQLISQEELEDNTKKLLQKIDREMNDFEKKIQEEEKRENDLKQKIMELETQREMTAREASKATFKARETREELKVKDLVLLDLAKHAKQTKQRLDDVSAEFSVVKNSRNKFANQSQSFAQGLAEMREKIKILSNEVEILRTESTGWDRALADEVRHHQNSKNERDALRVEHNKQLNEIRTKNIQKQQQLMEVEKLNTIVNKTEQEMISLRKNYSMAVDARNLTGIQLIDRNDELCILYEKKNIQDTILAKGEAAVTDLTTKAHHLTLEAAEIRRTLDLLRRRVPSSTDYQTKLQELKRSERSLEQEKMQVLELTARLEAPLDVNDKAQLEKAMQEEKLAGARGIEKNTVPRARPVPGDDTEPKQLQAKIELLQERLNEKKEQLLEKELVLDEVSSLTEKLSLQAAENRRSTLQLAQKVNSYQSRIRAITRKMMASVSELSMYQATAMKLEQERAEKEALLTTAKDRMESGQPPTEDAEHEWYRMERDRMRRQDAVLRRRAELSEQAALEEAMLEAQSAQAVVASRTTAEPRPNAYIPDDLGIPKPYAGTLGPFKPQRPGATMRHIRPPVIPDVVI